MSKELGPDSSVRVLQTPAGTFMGVDAPSREQESTYCLCYTTIMAASEDGSIQLMPYPVSAEHLELSEVENMITEFPRAVCISSTDCLASSTHGFVRCFLDFWGIEVSN